MAERGGTATAAEQAILARWSGWGAVPEVFDASRPELTSAREQLAAWTAAPYPDAQIRHESFASAD